MTISVSGYYPDAALKDSEFGSALTMVAMAIAKNGNSFSSSGAPKIELHFMLPGTFDSPRFEGMRIRAFDSKKAEILIEAAVPAHMVHSKKAKQYIVAAILDAIENTGEFLAENAVIFNTRPYIDMVKTFEAAIA